MARGNAIFDHADEEGQQPLLAQYHEDGQLFLTFFDIRRQELVTITTHQGAEPFLRRTADLVEPDTWDKQEIKRLEAQLQMAQLIACQFTDPIKSHFERMKAQGSAKTPVEALQIIVAEWEQARETVLKTIASEQTYRAQLEQLRTNFHALQDRLENWAYSEGQSYSNAVEILNSLMELAKLGKLLPEQLNVLQIHLQQSQEDLTRKSLALREAQELLASVNWCKGQGLAELLNVLPKVAAYCEKHELLAAEEIPF